MAAAPGQKMKPGGIFKNVEMKESATILNLNTTARIRRISSVRQAKFVKLLADLIVTKTIKDAKNSHKVSQIQ